VSVPTIADRPPAVPHEEFLERQERTRRAIAAAGLDGLLAWGSRDWSWAVRWLATTSRASPTRRTSVTRASPR
jgi:hypothetical protein